jgi:predicted transcriptional regulator YdeE
MNQAAKQQTYDVKAGLEKVQQFSVVGVSQMITAGPDGASEQINDLWQHFFESQIGHILQQRKDDIVYAVYSDYQGDFTKPYRLTIGFKMQDGAAAKALSPDVLHHTEVKTADYAMMSAAGEQPKALIEAWTAIWQSDLPRRYESDFEVYGPNFFKEGLHEILVCVGVNVN